MIYILNSYSKYAIPDADVAATRVPAIVNHHNAQYSRPEYMWKWHSVPGRVIALCWTFREFGVC